MKNRLVQISVILGLVSSALACSNGATDGSGGSGGAGGSGVKVEGDLPCDVDAVLNNNDCRHCHGTDTHYGAPMSLVTYADLVAPAVTDPSKKVYQLVDERIHDDKAPMPQAPYARLDAQDLATIDSWTKAGAPKGTESCNGAGGSGSGGSDAHALKCTPDIHVKPSQAFEMPKDKTDLYVCYGIDVTAGDRKNIIGFAPKIDNEKIVHHVLLYQSDTAVSATPAECDGSLSVSGRKLLYGWAPGGNPFELPDEAGMPMDEVTHYYVQVHYNNLQALSGEKDASGFDLCSTTDTRPNAADMVAFGTVKIDLPPHAETAADCSYSWPEAAGTVHAIAAFPHMHKLGTSIWTKQNPDSKSPGDLGKNAPWNFNNQPFIPIEATIKPGDTIETRCDWQNNTANTVKAGETTEDEMCFSFTMYYPRAESFRSWLQPSVLSTCK